MAGKIYLCYIDSLHRYILLYTYVSLYFYLTSWARERYIIETKLTQGIQSIGSTRGVSGHQHNPFAAVTIGLPNETVGETKGFSLIYSGNFLFEADLSELGRLRVNMGIHPMGFQWHLASNQEFTTPECILVRSAEGLGGMSRQLHRVFLDALIPSNRWSTSPPPILLNSWEAKYFQVSHDNIIEMATKAISIGIDMIVVDDGWFGKRDSDTSSLGDWWINIAKFPQGLKPLVDEINQLGCKFGLWFEPEMVSEQSVSDSYCFVFEIYFYLLLSITQSILHIIIIRHYIENILIGVFQFLEDRNK